MLEAAMPRLRNGSSARVRLALLGAALVSLMVIATACEDEDQPATETPAATADETRAPNGDDIREDIPSTVELVEEASPSVVHILRAATSFNVFGQVVPEEGVGTGFIIDEEGHIVTNNHVIQESSGDVAEDITVTLADGREFEARVVGRDPPTDVAVLDIDGEDLAPLELGASSDLRVGQDVVAIGNALNLPGGPTVTKGVVSALNRLIQEGVVYIPDAIQTDAAINPGNSGGPLINSRGEVIGITTAVIRGNAEGIGLAIAIDSARPIIEELIEQGEVDRGFLGVTIVQVTEALASQLDLPVESGVGVRAVQPGSPADGAGLVEGDVIVTIEGEEIETTGDLFRVLSQYRRGDRVTVEYFHGDEREQTEITLG